MIAMTRGSAICFVNVAFQRVAWSLIFAVASVTSLNGCVTTGYHYAKDKNLVKKWDATVISVEPQNIYKASEAIWVGTFATVEAKGWKVTFVTNSGEKVTIVQPSSTQYELRSGQRAVYIVDKGKLWVQPADFPLPPDFTGSDAQNNTETKDTESK